MTYKEKVIEIINKNITGYTKSKFTRNDEPFDVLADIGTIIKEIEALDEPDYEVFIVPDEIKVIGTKQEQALRRIMYETSDNWAAAVASSCLNGEEVIGVL